MTPFTATLRSEWTKLASLRSTVVILVWSLVLAIVLTVLLAVVVGETWGDWGPDERRDFEPIGWSLIGGSWSGILFMVLGIKAASAEYSAGMMRLTLTATPRRGRVLAAKARSSRRLTLVAALVSNLAMFLVAQAILGSYGIETPGLGDGDAMRTVVATAVLSPLLPVIALALGFALRSAAAAVSPCSC